MEKDTSVYFWTSQCTLSYLQWHCCPLFLTGSPRHSDLTGIHWRSRFGHHTDSVSSQRLKKQTVILIDTTPEPLGTTLENWRRRRSFLNHLSLSFPETDAPWFLCFFCVKWSFFFFVRKLFSGCYTLWKVLLEVTVELLFCGLLFNGFKKKQHSQFSFLLSLLWMLRFLLDFEPKNTLLSSMCYGEEGNKKLKGCDVSCSTSSIAHKHIFPLPHGINWRFTTWKDVKIVFEKASLCCCFFILDHRISKLWKIY